MQLEYGYLSLVFTTSLYNHFPTKNNNKKSKYIKTHLIFDTIGWTYELHNLVGKTLNIDVTNIVTFPN